MSRILRDLRIIVQAERLIAQRQFAVVRTRSGLLALAGGAAAIGVVMLNVGAFYALREPLGGAMAALGPRVCRRGRMAGRGGSADGRGAMLASSESASACAWAAAWAMAASRARRSS